MLNKINDESLNKEQLTHLHFAIGKSYEDLKNYKESFMNYDKANRYMKKIKNYEINKDIQEFAYIKKIFEKHNLS